MPDLLSVFSRAAASRRAAFLLLPLAALALSAEPAHPRLPFDPAALTLIDEVDLGADDPGHRLRVWPQAGVAVRAEILGRRCLTLPNGADAPDRYVAVRLGEGKGLKTGTPYVLQIEYPEDAPRSVMVWNAGNETCRSFRTGAAVGDALRMPYVFGNPESLSYPLAGAWRTWTTVIELHQRYPELKRIGDRPLGPADGFTVAIAHYRHANDPVSQGAAVGRIRLFAAPEARALELPLALPPEGLPRRHLFWREEMSDGILGTRDPKSPPAFDPARQLEWYAAKMRLMQFLGMDTYSRDLLEFGHNQGWDSSRYGGNDWVNQSDTPDLWHGLVGLAGGMGLNVLPMYEYCGSIGGRLALGPQKRCRTLAQAGKGPKGADNYTHVWWSEKGNADVTDPDTVEDLRRMLEITIADEAKRAAFVGAWLRPRNSGLPVSFSDRCLGLFADETGRAAPTRTQLQSDQALYRAYLDWWHERRRGFFVQIRDYLRRPEVAGASAVLLFTGDPSEPGRIIDDGSIVTDDPARFPGAKTLPFAAAVAEHRTLRAQTGETPTWGGWEWQHAVPRNDPQRYADTPGVLLTMAFSRLYSVGDPQAMAAFRTPDGLAMIRHYPLNEHCFAETKDGKDRELGYFVTDFEEAGPYCMLAEARALADGDPRFIGYLAANSFQRGFPQYVRAFNRAFLALPAVASARVEGASSDPAVAVRSYPAGRHGTWYAVINTGMRDAIDARIDLRQASLRDACDGRPVALAGTVATVSLYPGQVLAWRAP